MTRPAGSEIGFGPFRLDPANARLLRDGRTVPLTPKAFDVLHFLAGRPDRLVTKDELLTAIWPDVVVSDASVKVCVREIREALGDDVKSPTYIETAHRRGYRFIAAVGAAGDDVPAEPDARPAAAPPAPPALAPEVAPQATAYASPRTPLVGREADLRRLHDALDRARAGERQCVFVAGGPGSGKTALVETFLRQAQFRPPAGHDPGPDPGPLVVLAGHCFEQFGTSEPYMPVWEAVGRLVRERPSATLSALLARHAAAYTPTPTPAPGSGDANRPAHPAANEPRAMSERLLRELADALEVLAAEAPVVLMLDDVQWADYSTLDLVSAVARRRSPARLMVLATYRPGEVIGGEHPLPGLVQGLLAAGRCEELPLEFLNEPAVAQFLAARFPGGDLPPELAARLQQRTDGHPLFLVHLVDDLVRQGVLFEDGGRWRLSDPPAEPPERVPERPAAADPNRPTPADALARLDTYIPASVRAMIKVHVERLDRPERQVLEAAGVAGVEFSAAAAAAAVGEDVVRVEAVCDDLARRHHLLEPCGPAEWPDGTAATRFRFVHELYHNVVYEQVPVARRARLHGLVGSRLEAAWADRDFGELRLRQAQSSRRAAAEETAGIVSTLAMHFERAREWPRAATYLRHAAHAAARQYAHREAVHYLRRALAALDHLAPADRAGHELDVLMCLAVNLQATDGYAAPDVQAIHARAYSLCQSTVASTSAAGAAMSEAGEAGPGSAGPAAGLRWTFPVLWGIWVYHKVRSDLPRAADMARQLLAMAEQAGDPALMLQARQAMTVTALCLGQPALAAEQMERAAAIYDPARHAANTEWFGQDPGVSTLAFGAVALCLLGRPGEALAASGRAMDLAIRSGQPSTLALARHFAAMLHQVRGDAAETARLAEANIALAAEEGFSFWLAGGTILRGWAWAAGAPVAADGIGGPEAGVAEIRRGLEAWLATGSRTYHTYYLGLLADALLRLGRPAEALDAIDKALAAVPSLSERLHEAELYRLKGCALLQTDPAGATGPAADPPTAADCLARAMAVARDQAARWYEGRAATDLAGVFRGQGQLQVAAELAAAAAGIGLS